MNISIEELAKITKEYGGEWALNHTKRLIKTMETIAGDLQYNHQAIELAAYIHDWGAYQPIAISGVEHPLRSRQVAEEFLKEKGCDSELLELVLECIEHHHDADMSNSIEAKLLSDADALDFLGVVGVLRVFSKRTYNLRQAYEVVEEHIRVLQQRLMLDKSLEIANDRIKVMKDMMAEFDRETLGVF